MDDNLFVILGAGPCGIGAALTLQNEYPDQRFLIVDENTRGGGMAQSHHTDEGFVFDYGGHVLYPHKKYDYFGEWLNRWVSKWSRSCPIRAVYMHDRLIPTPIQRNVHRLPFDQFLPIVLDLIFNKYIRSIFKSKICSKDGLSLENYLVENFGNELTKRVMGPLNRKMWSIELSALNNLWVTQRSGAKNANVSMVNPARLLWNAISKRDDPGWTDYDKIEYPAQGGIGAIWDSAMKEISVDHVMLGNRVCSIDPHNKRIGLENGVCLEYSRLINTLPLDMFLRFCQNLTHANRLSEQFRYSSALLFGFGIRGSLPEKYSYVHSFQCPEPEYPFWRVTLPSNFSPENVPEPAEQYSVLCEISRNPSADLLITSDLRNAVVNGLSAIGLLTDECKIVSSFEKVLPYGYPLPFLRRDALLEEVHSLLEPMDIYSRGRFGGWRYEVSNQDHAFAQGREVIRRIMEDEPEQTYTFPQSVN